MEALKIVRDTNASFFLTGRAGTGKTTFLHYVRANVKKQFIVVAPTGVAAIVAGGVTIHSMFGMPLSPITKDTQFNIQRDKWSTLKRVDTIIVDEISMVRCDIIDGIDFVLRKAMGNDLPFGGKQIIFSGDLYQLEPVVERNETGLMEFFENEYGTSSPYFYYAHVLQRLNLPKIEFTKVYRQNDPEFQTMLNNIRHGRLFPSEISRINEIGMRNDEMDTEEQLILTSRNDAADYINQSHIDAIDEPIFRYTGIIEGDFRKNSFPAPEELELKKGARVMFTYNDKMHRWVNGTVGTIVELTEDSIMVQLDNELKVPVNRAEWENIQYRYNRITRKLDEVVIGTFKQYPLKLAWAITIHKSQGMTFDKLKLDLSAGVFMPGQLYVALSRVCSLSGLYLTSPIRLHYIMSKPEIDTFLGEYSDIELIAKDIKEYAVYYQALQAKDYDLAAKECFRIFCDAISQRKEISTLPIDARKKAASDNSKLEEKAYYAADRMLAVTYNPHDVIACDNKLQPLVGSTTQDYFLNAIISFANKDYEETIQFIDCAMLLFNNPAKLYYLKSIALLAQEKYNDADATNERWKNDVDVLDVRYYYQKAMTDFKLGKPCISTMIETIKIEPFYLPFISQIQQMMYSAKVKLPCDNEAMSIGVSMFNDNTDVKLVFEQLEDKYRSIFISSLINLCENIDL